MQECISMEMLYLYYKETNVNLQFEGFVEERVEGFLLHFGPLLDAGWKKVPRDQLDDYKRIAEAYIKNKKKRIYAIAFPKTKIWRRKGEKITFLTNIPFFPLANRKVLFLACLYH